MAGQAAGRGGGSSRTDDEGEPASVLAGLGQRVRPPEGINGGTIGRDMAVDLGTAKTRIYVHGRGIILDELSVVSINVRTGELLGFGDEAMRIVGSTPGHIQALWPLRHGAIADLEICMKMLQYFVNRVGSAPVGDGPRVAICVPSGLTDEEKAVLQEAGGAATLSRTYLIEAPLAAAFGAGMSVAQAIGGLVVDIGRGATRVAVIALGGIVSSHSVPIAGDEMDHAIQSFFRKVHGVLVGERTAEEIKIKLGSACLLEAELRAEVRGRVLDTGVPRTVVASTAEIREAISGQVGEIVRAVKATVDKTPPEFATEILEQGMVLTGGGALLNGLAVRLSNDTGMSTVVAENPLHSVVLGGVRFLEELE